MKMQKPLFEGVRVLELGLMIAGPLPTRLLAELGAEVIKVESMKRPDSFRKGGAFGDSLAGINRSRSFAEFNRNKKDITVDLSNEQGREVLKRLIRISDVVLDNFSLGVMRRWGLDYPQLKEIKPDIIVVDMQGLGQTGPLRHWVTNGMCLMAFCGMTYLWGLPSYTEPVGSQTAHPDYVAAAHAAFSILAALHYRARTGRGQHIDLAQVEPTAALMGPIYLDYLINQRAPQPLGNRSRYAAPRNCYRCKGEDRWCVIEVRDDADWRRFCQALGEPAWCHEERFADMVSRVNNVEELDRLVEAWTQERTPEEVMETLQQAGVPAGVVMTGKDLNSDPHLRERGFLVEIEHPEMTTLTFPGFTVRLSETPAQIRRHAPLLGQDNDYVYGELLGLAQREYLTLVEQGALV